MAARTQIRLYILASALCLCRGCSAPEQTTALDFQSLQNARGPEATAKVRFLDRDGKLAYRYYPGSTGLSVLYLHGGGAHGAAGYEPAAGILSGEFGISVLVPDLRGHGRSEGSRGHARNPEQIYEDVSLFLSFLRKEHSQVYLVGHSSGAGLALNYLTGQSPEQSESRTRSSSPEAPLSPYGVAFIAPELGPEMNAHRKGADFARVQVWPFVLHALSGGNFLGGYHAVSFAYPDRILRQDPLLLSSISVEMALALTPRNPAKQLQSLRKPCLLIAGTGDVLLDPEAFRIEENECEFMILKAGHLDIIHLSAPALGRWIVGKKESRDQEQTNRKANSPTTEEESNHGI